MPCCGDKRVQVRQVNQPRAEDNTPVYFQYTGQTGMTVIGRESRLRYRFDTTGAVLAVDARDKSALLAVPNLRMVKSTPVS